MTPHSFKMDPRDNPCPRGEQIACIEQRVDYITREFVTELQKTNAIVESMSKDIETLLIDRERVKGFAGGIVFLATGIGVFMAYVIEHITGWKF